MKKTLLASAIILALAATPMAFAKGKPPPSTEAANNLSFPVIMSDNIATLPADGVWRFATITNPQTQCIGEPGVVPGTPVDPQYLCYYGRKVVVVSETNTISFDPPGVQCDGTVTEYCKVWWLNKRVQNFWKALSVGHDVSTPLVVSAVDIGDLLESTPDLATRQIRTEFNLLQHVDPTDPELGSYVGLENCIVPKDAQLLSTGCFGALAMSGAVPGTQQSGSEMQGTDFGPVEVLPPAPVSPTPGTGSQAGRAPSPGGGSPIAAFADGAPVPGTRVFLDPANVRLTNPDVGGIQALVYARCARLVIQKVSGMPTWDRTTGQWAGSGVGAPVVNVATYRNEYVPEVTSSGSIVYGYNWNAKTVATGTYRLTFVLDGNDAEGPACTTTLGTMFQRTITEPTAVPGTVLVNVGEANQSGTIIYAGDSQLGDEGGLVYIDVPLSAKGGGGSGGRP